MRDAMAAATLSAFLAFSGAAARATDGGEAPVPAESAVSRGTEHAAIAYAYAAAAVARGAAVCRPTHDRLPFDAHAQAQDLAAEGMADGLRGAGPGPLDHGTVWGQARHAGWMVGDWLRRQGDAPPAGQDRGDIAFAVGAAVVEARLDLPLCRGGR